jgi:DNA-binding NarL/FixJ family response regulator
LRVGIDDYIVKPFDLDELVKKLRPMMERRAVMAASRAEDEAADASAKRIVVGSFEEAARITEVLRALGYVAMSAADAVSALGAKVPLYGAVLSRKECTDAVKALVWEQRLRNPAFRLIVVTDAKGLSDTVSSILMGASGQLASPLGEPAALREALAEVLSGSRKA